MDVIEAHPRLDHKPTLRRICSLIRSGKRVWVIGTIPGLRQALRLSEKESPYLLELRVDPTYRSLQDTYIGCALIEGYRVEANDTVLLAEISLDALAAAAVLQLRSVLYNTVLNLQHEERVKRLLAVARGRRGRWQPLPWPNPVELWPDKTLYPEVQLPMWPLVAMVDDPHRQLAERVAALRSWLQSGRIGLEYEQLVKLRRKRLSEALAAGALSVESQLEGRYALVLGLDCWGGHLLGFHRQPVVVTYSAAYQDGSEAPTQHVSVAQYSRHYVDSAALTDRLGWTRGTDCHAAAPASFWQTHGLEDVFTAVRRLRRLY